MRLFLSDIAGVGDAGKTIADPAAPQDKVITAFQRHFRPEKLDGQWDGECAGLLASLCVKVGV